MGAVGTGVSIANDHDHPSSTPGANPSQPAEQPGEFTPSRLSWSAYLTGEEEVDENGADAGDPAGKGSAVFLQDGSRRICYGFVLRGVEDEPSAVHIHAGKAGENGPIVVTFNNAPKNADGKPSGSPGTSSGCKTATDPKEIKALADIRRDLRDPSRKDAKQYYVNFHTKTEFPKGAVRGQLSALQFNNQPQAPQPEQPQEP